jgi:UDP-glucose 4-epimerase
VTDHTGSGPSRPVAGDAPTLVIGAGGLLGSAIVRRLTAPIAARGIAWTDPDRAAIGLESAVQDLARSADGGATVIWVAGRAVIASSADEIDAETRTFARFLDVVERHLGMDGTRFLLASSAGALYAASTGAPFDEGTDPAPLSDYGRGKLEQERLLTEWAVRTGGRAIAARLATVYGTGQDPTKAQGLVTALCRSVMTRAPVRVFVPLDTRRHLVWEEDAARAIIAHAHGTGVPSGDMAVRVVATPSSVTIGETIATVARVTRSRPSVLQAAGREAARHGVDLRLRSAHPLAEPMATPLVVGVARVWRALLRSL